MFGDGVKKGSINQPGLPYIQNGRLVKGLSTNLISISELYDQGFSVNFSKDKHEVVDKKSKVILSGTRLSQNCYH